MLTYDNENAATVEISPEKSRIVLHEFQEEAMRKLNEVNKRDEFSGLLVLPTGAGKTMTAAYWLLKNATDKGKKVLWIAHRHLFIRYPDEEDDSARYCYESVGFRPVGKTEIYKMPIGEWECVEMELVMA